MTPKMPNPRRANPGRGRDQRADAEAELAPILRAKLLTKCTVLDVVCPNNERLARVVQTPSYLVLIGKGTYRDTTGFLRVWLREWKRLGLPDPENISDIAERDRAIQKVNAAAQEHQEEWNKVHHETRRHDVVVVLGGTGEARNEIRTRVRGLQVDCRCRSVELPSIWIKEQIQAGKRRVVWSDENASAMRARQREEWRVAFGEE